jgi:hypothetical protein
VKLKNRSKRRKRDLPVQTGDHLIGVFLPLNVNYRWPRDVVRIVIRRVLRLSHSWRRPGHEGRALMVGGTRARGYGRFAPEGVGTITVIGI